MRGRIHGLVIGIEYRLKKKQRGETARGVGDFAGFVGRERTAQQLVLAVAQPLFQDLKPPRVKSQTFSGTLRQ